MTLDAIRREFAKAEAAIKDVLDEGGFFDVEGRFDAQHFMRSIPLSARQQFNLKMAAKNRRIWAALQRTKIKAALARGARDVAKSNELPAAAPSKRYLASRSKQFIKYMNQSDQDRFKKFVMRNASGTTRPSKSSLSSQPWIASMVDSTGSRTKNITQYEEQRAYEYGGWEYATKQGGLKTRREVMDNHTRPSHRRMNGETVPIERPFSNGEMYPGERDIGCRGHIQYTLEESDIHAKVAAVKKKQAAPRKPKVKSSVASPSDQAVVDEGDYTVVKLFKPWYDDPRPDSGAEDVRVYNVGKTEIYVPDDSALRSLNKLTVGDLKAFIGEMHPDTRKRITSITLNPFPLPPDKQVLADGYAVATARCGSKKICIHGQQPMRRQEVLSFMRDSGVLDHEVGHTIDYEAVMDHGEKTLTSRTPGWLDAMKGDMTRHSKSGNIAMTDLCITDYATASYLQSGGDTIEDFAESVAKYCKDPIAFEARYKNRFAILKKVM